VLLLLVPLLVVVVLVLLLLLLAQVVVLLPSDYQLSTYQVAVGYPLRTTINGCYLLLSAAAAAGTGAGT